MLRIAAALAGEPNLEHLRSFCLHQAKGLRDHAFADLRLFLEEMTVLPNRERWRLADLVMDAWWRHREEGKFLTTPLRKEFLLPAFSDWSEHEPNRATPKRWLGWLAGEEIAPFREALALEPNDGIARIGLIRSLLDRAHSATHHLSGSILLGDVEVVKAEIDEARSMAEGLPDPRMKEAVLKECDAGARVLAHWIAFKKDQADDFPAWCQARDLEDYWYYRNPLG